MNIQLRILFSCVLTAGFLCFSTTIAEITADPFGFMLSIEQDAEMEMELVLSNDGEEDVAFSIDYELILEEDDRRAGPRRDDLGDEVFSIDAPGGSWFAITWGDELIWGALHSGNSRVIAYNMDGEMVADWQLNIYAIGMAWDGEALYIGNWSGDLNIHRYDVEGDHLGQINPNTQVTGVGWDGENLWILDHRNNRQIRQISLQGEVLGTWSTQDLDNNSWLSLTYVPEHNDGHVWVKHNNGMLYQLNLEEDDPEIVQRHQLHNGGNHFGLDHDGENLWYTFANSWISVDDGVEEFHMLSIEPEEGVIPGDDEETINILVSSVDCEAGVYNMLIEIELSEPEEERDDLVQTLIQMSAVVTVEDPTYALSGVVIDAATDEVVENAMVEMDIYQINRYSDDEGGFELENLPPGEYELTFTAADYLPNVEDISIEDDDVDLTVELLHSECTPSREEFFMELEPDMGHEFDFRITNGGNGPLTYTTERRLLGEANAEPWELREAENIENVVNDDMLNGVIFAAGHFFITGGNNGDDVSKIYKINTDGELVDEFDQFAESRYGMRDLAYDGELIWGADQGVLYGFTTDGELESLIESPADIECRSLTWDPDNRLLITSDITTDIYAIDLEGDLVETFERPQELRVYGLGFWPDDPDGYDLYVFCRGDTTDLQVNKFNLEDGDYMIEAELNIDGGRPGGVQITNQLDVYSWVFITIVQNPDRLAIWQLEARKEWFQVEPVEGVIEAEESEDFVLTLDATGLPSENTFEGEIVFSHDGVGAETVLSVRLDVVEGEIHTTRNIEMEIGWNLVSTNLQPDDEENIRGLMAELVEEELLVLMKNSDGEFYRPDYDYNNIPGWYVEEGYQILVSGDCVLTLEGMSVMRDRAIPLEQGWQIASYYPRFPVDAIVALSGIVDHLIIAKDGRGNFYLPDWDFSNMGDMCEGQGYYLNVDEDIELIYQTGEEANALVEGSVRHSSVYDAPGRLPVHAVTGENMSLLVLTEAPTPVSGGGIEGGGAVGIYAGGQLVGSGVLQDGICGIAVWGDDPATEAIDGALEGQSLEVRLLDDNGVHSVSYVVLSGKTVYRTDSFAAIRLNEISELPSEFGIISTYPNPFNARTRIVYGLPEAARVDLAVYDLSGRRVSELASGRQEAGIHTVTFEGSGFASGVYMVHLEAGGSESLWKVALIK